MAEGNGLPPGHILAPIISGNVVPDNRPVAKHSRHYTLLEISKRDNTLIYFVSAVINCEVSLPAAHH